MQGSGRGRTPAAVVTHGGAGAPEEIKDGCERANTAAREILQRGGSALDAAVAAVVVLEDDDRMNAGTGAVIRLDGVTIQTDAALMDGAGFGAVAALAGFKNPIKLARVVYDLPHLMLAGEGAEALADKLGHERGDLATAKAKERAERRAGKVADLDMWAGHDLDEVWNFALDSGTACDTVGAVVRAPDGTFAAAGSTGGLWCALKGRVGDTPIPGAGLYVGEQGAVAATGVGELIWQRMMSLRAYDLMATGMPVEEALAQIIEIANLPSDVDIGLIAVSRDETASVCTRRMPWAAWVGDL